MSFRFCHILFFIFFSLSLNSFAEELLTDEQALDLGMTPVEKLGLNFSSYGLMNNKKNISSDLIDKLIDKSKIVVVVNKSIRSSSETEGQTLRVYQDGKFVFEYDISTGTEALKKTTSGKEYVATTPVGIYRPISAYEKYQSQAFLGSPMDYAIFFVGGIAIHSTIESNYPNLGKRASGGCIRLQRENAQVLNEMIVSTGTENQKLVDESFTVKNIKLNRTRYANRIEVPEVDPYRGIFLPTKMKSYDALIIVHE